MPVHAQAISSTLAIPALPQALIGVSRRRTARIRAKQQRRRAYGLLVVGGADSGPEDMQFGWLAEHEPARLGRASRVQAHRRQAS